MKHFGISLLVLLLCFQGQAQEICAHRGFWQCEEAVNSQNSLAALRLAQESGLWGSEFDVHLTADEVAVVNHDSDFYGLPIATNTYRDLLARCRLPNGESLTTLFEYLEQGSKSPCMLVLEVKPQPSVSATVRLVQRCVQALRSYNLLDPSRVMFISFSFDACEWIARHLPAFDNQYLGGDKDPETVYGSGINGIDYHYSVFHRHPDWVARAHALGMSVNVWTVDKQEEMVRMKELGVDVITTNKPLLLREVLIP